MNTEAYIVFTRVPRPNQCKRRLTTRYSGEQASAIQAAMLSDLLREAKTLLAKGIDVWVAYEDGDGDSAEFLSQLPEGVRSFPQQGSQMGQKMDNAIQRVFQAGYQKVVLTGSDVPFLSAKIVQQAFSRLSDVVIGPTFDGGYYLIGCRRGVSLAPIFSSKIHWSASDVWRDTLKKLENVDVQVMSRQKDVDLPGDFASVVGKLGSRNQELAKVIKSLKLGGI